LAGSTAESSDTNKKRPLVGGLILVGAFAVAVIVAGYYIQDRDGPAVGVADQSIENLEDVSNETMEAVVAANLEHPRVNGMRLALAERYFEISDYRSAFPHYLAVAESALAKPDEAVTALVRLGWMAWEGNGEVEAALGLLDQALVIEPNATGALFLKARVLWCGSNDPISAKAILDDILAQPDLSSDSRQAVESELKTLATGLGCE
jgi:tetratricopeptide (TPR) repeat protein